MMNFKKKKNTICCASVIIILQNVMSEWDILMIFIFDFNFCPDDEEKFAANARNYELLRTHTLLLL